jgi:alpha-tubulin suppressor-like RCC1 family protein
MKLSALSTGPAHTAVVTTCGAVLTCGFSSDGQLGRSGPTESLARVPGLPRMVAVAAGGRHTIAVDAEGKLYSWGQNTRGQLGREGGNSGVLEGGVVRRLVTSLFPGRSASSWHKVVGGEDAGVEDDVWGEDDPRRVRVIEDAGERVTSVAAGGDFSMALCESGAVLTWGAGGNGRLGHGAELHGVDERRPRRVQALAGELVTAVAAGGHAAGAVAGGGFLIWGAGGGVGGGVGVSGDCWVPRRILSLVGRSGGGREGGKLAFGVGHVVFLSGGKVYCLGGNERGCGGGTLHGDLDEDGVQVAVGGAAVDIAAGWHASYAAVDDGGVVAWGSGGAGAIGREEMGDVWGKPVPVQGTNGCRHVAAGSAGRHCFAW